MQEAQLLELQTPVTGEVRSAYNLVTNLASNTGLGLYQLNLLRNYHPQPNLPPEGEGTFEIISLTRTRSEESG